jgi:hypothetical protein
MRSRGLAAVVLLSLLAPAGALAAAVDLPSLLSSEIASAKQSAVKVLIPSQIKPGVPHLYGSGGRSGHGYAIDLGAVPRCGEANACFVADFLGGRGALSFTARVSLAKGITGAFHPSTCGASCAPATIQWREFGALYTIQFGGAKSSLVALADSAIEAGPR